MTIPMSSNTRLTIRVTYYYDERNQIDRPTIDRPTEVKMKLVTLIPGDGIGREVVDAATRLVDAAGAAIEWELQEAGAAVFARGVGSGVPAETIE